MPYFLLAMTVLFWAGNFVAARAIHADFPPLTLSFTRWTLALLLILPFVLPRIWRKRQVIRDHLGILVLLGIIGVASFNSLIYVGVQTTQASNATLMQSAIPIMILVISSLFLKEQVAGRQWLGVFISLAGVVVLVARGSLDSLLKLSFNQGDLWIFGAVTCWSVYSVMLRWKPEALDGFTFFGFTVMVAVAVLMPLAALEYSAGARPVIKPETVSAALYMAICPSILSYIFWNRGVAQLGAATAGLFIHLMTPFGLILSVVFLNEQVETFHFIGISLIFSGIYLAILSARRRAALKSS